ncbi:MAG TPA: GAF domain-containing protein [Candidatus Acidoferrum sp.]|nr:GAF domain-containing protein [Candidatus Acidoferrum sp.]
MATPDSDIRTPFSKGEELLEMMRKGQEFTTQLMKENERLRLRCIQMEKEILDLKENARDWNVEALLQERAGLIEKLTRLEKRFSEMEEENQSFATKYVEITQQNESLANLYVASHQLHSTLDPQEVLGIVNEILINLVGAEEFAVFLVDRTTKELTPVTGEGILPKLASGELVLEEDFLEQVVKSGNAYYHNGQSLHPGRPLACVPLKIKQDVVGAIAIFKLLIQKEGFTPMDSEILNLLAGHAATSIVGSHLHADAERKLKTIEGFMELFKRGDSQPETKLSRNEGPGA